MELTWFKVTAKGDVPQGRAGLTCTTVGNKIVLFGGGDPSGVSNEVFVYAPDTQSWHKINTTGDRPPARYEHSAFYDEATQDIYVFAGANSECSFNDIYALDSDFKWRKVVCKGSIPSPRTIHLTGSFTKKFYVFGGGESGSTPVNDKKLYEFDTETSTWSVVNAKGTAPPPRLGHSMTQVGSRLFVFGGMAESQVFNDIHIFDLVASTWSTVPHAKYIPTARTAHAVAAQKQLLYITGGLSFHQGIPNILNDTVVYDTESNTWHVTSSTADPPPARLDASLCILAPKS
eukprot:Colp12_sorted_trinity150504_noHs@4348